MGITLTFYATTLEDFLAVWLQEDENTFLSGIAAISNANFSLHLRFPEDLNDLWQCFHNSGIAVAPSFEEDAKLIWATPPNEHIFVIHPEVTQRIADLTARHIFVTATMWNAMYLELFSQNVRTTATYAAIQALQKVAHEAVEAAVPLLLYVML